jgi:hypothetical protein
MASRWPDACGYLDFVTDDRDPQYVRTYVGQSSQSIFWLVEHISWIRRGGFTSLHYYILQAGFGHRSANFIRLWTFQIVW